MSDIIKKLKEPFAYSEIEWKIQTVKKDKTGAMAVAYIDSRAIQKRLDEFVGEFNWKNEYKMWQDKSQICGISIYNEERGEWVTKYDGSDNTNIEPIKGGLSDAFKRAAVLWGIGRYLREIDGVWVDIEEKYGNTVIKANQYVKLEAEYNRAVFKEYRMLPQSAPPPSSFDRCADCNAELVDLTRDGSVVKKKTELKDYSEKTHGRCLCYKCIKNQVPAIRVNIETGEVLENVEPGYGEKLPFGEPA
jgi:hypothetical protein